MRDEWIRKKVSTIGHLIALRLGCHRQALLEAEERFRNVPDPEAVHDLRVGMRRLRATLWAWSTELPSSLAGLDEQAKRLGRTLGEVRDRDVQLELLCDAPPSVLAPLRAEREAHLILCRQAIGSEAYAQVLSGLGKASMFENLLRAADLARQVVDRAEHGFRKAAKKLCMSAPSIHFHEARKRGKRFRYVLEDVGTLISGASKQIQEMKEIQDLLGKRQDAATAIETLMHLLRNPELDREAVRRSERMIIHWNDRERQYRRKILEMQWTKR